jgi:hypothetical protein
VLYDEFALCSLVLNSVTFVTTLMGFISIESNIYMQIRESANFFKKISY